MKKSLCAAAIAATFASAPSFATNGYLAHGYGAVSKSMGGACVAMVEDAMCSIANPATLVHLDDQFEMGVNLFSPSPRGFDADATYPEPYNPIPPGHYVSTNRLYLIPHFAYNKKLDDKSAVSVMVDGQGGMNTEYPKHVFGRFPPFTASSPTGVNLAQVFMGISYSRQLDANNSVAVMPIIAGQAFEARGLEPMAGVSVHPDKVTNQGTDTSWGGGLRLGWFWQPNDELNVGVSYQSRIWMTRFKDYKGLFAEQGDFDMPPVLDLGFAYDFQPDWTFSFNYQRIWYEDVRALGNAGDIALAPGVLGSDKGLGFGWKDQNVYKFGLKWQFSPDLTLRAGYSYGTDVVESGQALFNLLTPAVVKKHYTLGFSKALDAKNTIHMSGMYAPEETLHGTNINTGAQTGDIFMKQWEVALTWEHKL